MPDSLQTTGRQAHPLEIVVPIGDMPPTRMMMDLPWLATQYPPIAETLTAAGLTAADHQAYRFALIIALMLHAFPSVATPIGPGSVLTKNIAFVESHKDELLTLQYRLGVWETP